MNFYLNPNELTGRYQLIQIAVVGGPSKKLLYDIMHMLYLIENNDTKHHYIYSR
jgi:hypothetical protein